MNGICALLRYYAAYGGTSVPTFREKLSVPSSRIKKYKKFYWNSWPSKTGSIGYSERSVRNYHSKPRNMSQESRSQHKTLKPIFFLNTSLSLTSRTLPNSRSFFARRWIHLLSCLSIFPTKKTQRLKLKRDWFVDHWAWDRDSEGGRGGWFEHSEVQRHNLSQVRLAM